MTGMPLNEFIDRVYYGDQITFEWNGLTYLVQGNGQNGVYSLTVDY